MVPQWVALLAIGKWRARPSSCNACVMLGHGRHGSSLRRATSSSDVLDCLAPRQRILTDAPSLHALQTEPDASPRKTDGLPPIGNTFPA